MTPNVAAWVKGSLPPPVPQAEALAETTPFPSAWRQRVPEPPVFEITRLVVEATPVFEMEKSVVDALLVSSKERVAADASFPQMVNLE